MNKMTNNIDTTLSEQFQNLMTTRRKRDKINTPNTLPIAFLS